MQWLRHLNFDTPEETEIHSKFNYKKYLSHLKFNKPEEAEVFPDFNNQPQRTFALSHYL